MRVYVLPLLLLLFLLLIAGYTGPFSLRHIGDTKRYVAVGCRCAIRFLMACGVVDHVGWTRPFGNCAAPVPLTLLYPTAGSLHYLADGSSRAVSRYLHCCLEFYLESLLHPHSHAVLQSMVAFLRPCAMPSRTRLMMIGRSRPSGATEQAAWRSEMSHCTSTSAVAVCVWWSACRTVHGADLSWMPSRLPVFFL